MLDRIAAGLTICAAFRTSKYGILCEQNMNMYCWLMNMTLRQEVI